MAPYDMAYSSKYRPYRGRRSGIARRERRARGRRRHGVLRRRAAQPLV
jgi:hypothetical protein